MRKFIRLPVSCIAYFSELPNSGLDATSKQKIPADKKSNHTTFGGENEKTKSAFTQKATKT
jgi:hypothetical protein